AKTPDPASCPEGPIPSPNAASTPPSSPCRACSRTNTYCSTVPLSPARHRLCLDFFASLASKGDGHLHFDHSSGFGRNVLSFVTISETLEKERKTEISRNQQF